MSAEKVREARGFRRGSSTTTSGIPDDLKERGVRRVVIFAWMVLVIDAVGTIIDHVAEASTSAGWPTRFHVFDLVGSGAIAVICVAMLLVARSKLSVDRRVWAGTAYFFLLAFSIAITDFGDGFWTRDGGAGHPLHGIPSLVAVMIVTPIIVPMNHWRALVVALGMAATGPAAMLIDAKILDLPIPDAQPLMQSFPFLMVPVSAALAYIVHQLGLEVKRARALGFYTLEDKLGEGGMGEVWRAKHRFLARPAAVKLIRDAGNDATKRERFEREAQATASLKSAHTIDLYEFGISRDGEIYYIMELLDGLDLEALVGRDGPQPASRVVSWLSQACHSLAEAHAAGIIHRDIKPANLFICRYGLDDDFLKVLDFGLATLAPKLDASDPRLTDDNTIVGTPAYMPPELATGKSPVDARSDIYALGCVAYFALTGKRVFEADSPIEVIVGHVDKAPIPPTEVVSQPIPPSLERIVLDCLAKSPDDRPASIGELKARLDDVES